ncbi:MAG: NADH-quinone oxidoreductase subunit NuoK [Chloroflexota bacterium]
MPLSWYLFVAAGLFSIGLYGVMSRKNAIIILMSIELMLNAINLNLIAFWRFRDPETVVGQVFTALVIAVGAAEVAIGLGLVISLYRQQKTVSTSKIDLLKW